MWIEHNTGLRVFKPTTNNCVSQIGSLLWECVSQIWLRFKRSRSLKNQIHRNLHWSSACCCDIVLAAEDWICVVYHLSSIHFWDIDMWLATHSNVSFLFWSSAGVLQLAANTRTSKATEELTAVCFIYSHRWVNVTGISRVCQSCIGFLFRGSLCVVDVVFRVFFSCSCASLVS